MKVLGNIATQDVSGTKIGVDISSLQRQAYQLQQVMPMQDKMMLGLGSSFLTIVVLLLILHMFMFYTEENRELLSGGTVYQLDGENEEKQESRQPSERSHSKLTGGVR